MPSKAPPKPKTYQTLRGMRDLLPDDQPYWQWVADQVRDFASAYGYQRIDTPLVELTSLFVRSVGDQTDIVEKEMYSWTDGSGDQISLRPEGTAGVARAYIEHGMQNLPQPVKLHYQGPMFRHERPQAGRYRQHHQFGFEVLGDPEPVLDAELMLLAHRLYGSFGLPITAQVNSIGDQVCRPEYTRILQEYYRSHRHQLCEDCKRRLLKNPLRLLDCKGEGCQQLAQSAPQQLDHLCEPCRKHFVQVLEYLDRVEVPYELNPRIVRGLDYYTRTTFEFLLAQPLFSAGAKTGAGEASAEGQPKAQSSLGGGGRYDGLLSTLGGPATPAVGFACGIERLVLALKERQIAPPAGIRPRLYLAQLGNEARKQALELFEQFRQAGVPLAQHFSKNGLKAQLEQANRLGVKYTLIIGQKEIMDQTVLIRDMENGIQETVAFERVVPEVRKRLERYASDDPVVPLPAEANRPIAADVAVEEDDLVVELGGQSHGGGDSLEG